MQIIGRVAAAMQTLLTIKAREEAKRRRVIRRKRGFDGASLVQTLVFGWLANPAATLEQLAQTAAGCGASVTPQAINQRFRSPLASLLEHLLGEAVAEVVAGTPRAVPLLARFAGVYVDDSTTIGLPDALRDKWRGCGGANGQSGAALKLQVRLDLLRGQLLGPYLEPGRSSDQRSSLQTDPLPKGALRLADLGYFNLETLRRRDERGVYFLSRLQRQTALFAENGAPLDLLALLKKHPREPLEIKVFLGAEERLPCRLLIRPVSEEEARRRRERKRKYCRKHGKPFTEAAKQWCRWTVLVTNAPEEKLSLAEAFVMQHSRWQIELLFKLWKQRGQVDESRSENPTRVLIEIYAKLLGVIVQHWILLTRYGDAPDLSLVKASAAVRNFALVLVLAMPSRRRLEQALAALVQVLDKRAKINCRRSRPPNHQLLENPGLLNS